MGAPVRLFLDLGDLITKCLVVRGQARQRLRFPSIVARQVVDGSLETSSLFLDQQDWHVLLDLDGATRLRSFPSGQAFLSEVRKGPHPVAGARFAGWLAAVFGVDRECLGGHPSQDNIRILTRRTLLLCGAGEAEVVFIVDTGGKAEAIARYAAEAPATDTLSAWSFSRCEKLSLHLRIESRVIDAAACALSALPAEMALEKAGRVLLVDIGYYRTKLAVVSKEGVEHMEQLELGAADCVRRVLRDEHERGLVEDEVAVIRAIESGHGHITVAGRRHDVKSTLEAAKLGVAEELARELRRLVLEDYRRRGEMCRAVAFMGGGALMIASRIPSMELEGCEVWISEDPSFLLVEGASRIARAEGPLTV